MRHVRLRLLAVLVVALALVAGACGNDSDSGGGSGSGNGNGGDAKSAPTEADARAALLTSADVPSGWQGGEPAEDAADDEADDSNFCKEFDAADAVEPAAEAETEFAAAETGPFLLHAVSLYEDEDQASEVMDLFEEAVEKCRTFTDTDEDLGKLEGSLTKTDGGDRGDESIGATLSASGTGMSMSGEIVVVRTGRGVFMLMQFGMQIEGFGGSEQQEGLIDDLSAKALAKLEAAA